MEEKQPIVISHIFCTGCKRNMTLNSGVSVIAISINPVNFNIPEIYPELTQNETYNFCYVCLLNALGARLKERIHD